MNKLSVRQWVYRFVALFVTVLSLLFFVLTAMKHFNEVPALSWNTASTITAAMTVGLVVLNIGIGGVIWRCLLLDNGVSVFWRQVLVIFSIAQLGKYLPGNVGQHVGRVFMAKEIDIPITITLCTMMVEMLWGVGIGGGLAIAALIEFVDGDKLGLQFSPLQLGLGTFILLFMPWLGIGFLNKYLPKLAKRLSGGGVMATPKLLTAVFVAVLFLLCFVIMGLILKLQAQWFFGVTKGNMFELTCLFSVAWLAGYLLPGAPAGLGVREAVMVLLLSPVLGAGTAVGLGITLRVTTTVGDAVAFMLGVTVRKLNARLFISTLS